MEVSGYLHVPAALFPGGKTPVCPFNRRLGGESRPLYFPGEKPPFAHSIGDLEEKGNISCPYRDSNIGPFSP